MLFRSDNISKCEDQSGHAIIQVAESGENGIIIFGGANHSITKTHIDNVLCKFGAGDIMLLQNEINLIHYLIEQAYEKGIQIALNPSPFNKSIEKLPLNKVSYLILNKIEGKELTKCISDNGSEILEALKRKYCSTKIVLTLGKEGVVYFDGTNEYKFGVYDVNILDTTAAGDTFTGYFLACLIKGFSPERIVEIASKAASIAVSREGASPSIPTMKEVLESNITVTA